MSILIIWAMFIKTEKWTKTLQKSRWKSKKPQNKNYQKNGTVDKVCDRIKVTIFQWIPTKINSSGAKQPFSFWWKQPISVQHTSALLLWWYKNTHTYSFSHQQVWCFKNQISPHNVSAPPFNNTDDSKVYNWECKVVIIRLERSSSIQKQSAIGVSNYERSSLVKHKILSHATYLMLKSEFFTPYFRSKNLSIKHSLRVCKSTKQVMSYIHKKS